MKEKELKHIEIRMVGIIDTEIEAAAKGKLFTIPIKLNLSAPSKWSDIFFKNWKNDSHKNATQNYIIPSVRHNKIFLFETTVEEIAKKYRLALMSTVKKTNIEYNSYVDNELAKAERIKLELEKQKKIIFKQRKAAKDVKF